MKQIIILVFILISSIFSNTSYAEKKLKFALFTLRDKEDMYFSMVVDYMEAACKSLGIELTTYYSNDDHFLFVEKTKEATKEKKFDAIFTVNFKKQLINIAEIIENSKTPFFIYNAGFEPNDKTGNPREKFKFWIGEILPDDESAGYNLAKIISQNIKPSADGIKHMVGFAGNLVDQASVERVKGLQKFIQSSKGTIKLDQLIHTNWIPKIAKDKFSLIHQRYPNVKGYWAASDGMAIAITEKAKEINFSVTTGGVDWSNEGIDAVKKGKIVATMGGQFMDAGWAAVILYDYFNGIDFKNSEGLRLKTKMSAITKENIDEYLATIGNRANWNKIDFKKFSKKHDNKIKKYNFSKEALFKQFSKK